MLIAVGFLANEYDSIRSNEMVIGSTLEVLDVHVTPILSSFHFIDFLKQNSILPFQLWICMPDCNISKPGLGLPISEAKPKPIVSPHKGQAGFA